MQSAQPSKYFVEGFTKQCSAFGVDPELLIAEFVKQGGIGATIGSLFKAKPPLNALGRATQGLKRGIRKTLIGGGLLAGAGGVGYAYGKENDNIY